MTKARNASTARDSEPDVYKPVSVKIRGSNVRVELQPPASMPSPARRKALAEAVRATVAELARKGE